jgi:uncharacterized protein YcbK (DUF882 family)
MFGATFVRQSEREPMIEPAPTEAKSSLKRLARSEPMPTETDDIGVEFSHPKPKRATLVNVHTREHELLAESEPSSASFKHFMHDRATGAEVDFDPKLLEIVRRLEEKHPRARFELVSGFRSPKLNEMMRKKGHHVASHSQHSLGHALDFRVIPEGAESGIDPRELEKEVRALGWEGGTGVYPMKTDWFIHCDVGRNRHWTN